MPSPAALPNNISPLQWIREYLPLIGWPAIVYFAWQVSKYFERVSKQVVKTITQIDSMATNHFPHMEASLANQDVLMHSMDKSLKVISYNTGKMPPARLSSVEITPLTED